MYLHRKRHGLYLYCTGSSDRNRPKAYTEGLFADNLAPSMERGRILTDEHFQTSIPGIYAIGDVNGKLQLAHAAIAQGFHAVHHIAAVRSTADFEQSVSSVEDPILDLVPSCIYTSPEIASVGLTLDQAKEQGLQLKAIRF